ncbi:hypothetical protein PR048_018994 [Dryococelus australis]|uniref:Uncharacterized protein n=1 Tax=Dryococelus australis TaxID=614101 RepID=A0ABQ9H283_9NEOP|nr:hypothetical protein PR048_018994 [Dryococelus australis]
MFGNFSARPLERTTFSRSNSHASLTSCWRRVLSDVTTTFLCSSRRGLPTPLLKPVRGKASTFENNLQGKKKTPSVTKGCSRTSEKLKVTTNSACRRTCAVHMRRTSTHREMKLKKKTSTFPCVCEWERYAAAKHLSLWGRGGVVVRQLASHRVRLLAGSLPGFRTCRTMPLVGVVFSGMSLFPRPCIPALLHTHLASHSSALKNSMLRRVLQWHVRGHGSRKRTRNALRVQSTMARMRDADDVRIHVRQLRHLPTFPCPRIRVANRNRVFGLLILDSVVNVVYPATKWLKFIRNRQLVPLTYPCIVERAQEQPNSLPPSLSLPLFPALALFCVGEPGSRFNAVDLSAGPCNRPVANFSSVNGRLGAGARLRLRSVEDSLQRPAGDGGKLPATWPGDVATSLAPASSRAARAVPPPCSNPPRRCQQHSTKHAPEHMACAKINTADTQASVAAAAVPQANPFHPTTLPFLSHVRLALSTGCLSIINSRPACVAPLNSRHPPTNVAGAVQAYLIDSRRQSVKGGKGKQQLHNGIVGEKNDSPSDILSKREKLPTPSKGGDRLKEYGGVGSRSTPAKPTCAAAMSASFPPLQSVTSAAPPPPPITFDVRGACRLTNARKNRVTVAERLSRSPPTKANRVRYPAGSLRIFASVGTVPDDALGGRAFSGFSRLPRPFIPAPLH